MSSEGEETIIKDHYYYKVIDDRFPTYECWYNYLLSIFEKGFMDEKLLSQEHYASIDGKLYGEQADRGTNIYYTRNEFKVKSQTDDKIELIEIYHFNEDGKKYTDEATIIFKKVEGEWRISQFEICI